MHQSYCYVEANKNVGICIADGIEYVTARIKVHFAKGNKYHAVPALPKEMIN